MAEESYNLRQTNKRFLLWLAIFTIIFGTSVGTYSLVPNPLAHPEYVPTIANGFVASMSILMALAFFSLTQFHSNIIDKGEKQKYHLLLRIYLVLLFFVFFFGIVVGYGLVLNDLPYYAINCFIIVLLLQSALLMDSWMTSDRYTFR